MSWGGYRPNAGRKKYKKEEEKHKQRNLYLNEEDYKKVKAFVEKLKKGV